MRSNRLVVIMLLVLQGASAMAASKSSSAIYTHAAECIEELQVNDPFRYYEPHFTKYELPHRDFLMVMMHKRRTFSLEFRKQEFATFSPDGRMTVIHHQDEMGAEQLSLRYTASGQLVGSLLWDSKLKAMAHFKSVVIDEANGRVLALGGNADHGQNDEFITWDYKQNRVAQFKLQPFAEADFSPSNMSWPRHIAASSALSISHPYLLRQVFFEGEPDGEGGRGRSMLRLNNLETEQEMVFPDAYPLLTHLSPKLELINANYKFVAVPSTDAKRVDVYRFNQIESYMPSVKPDPSIINVRFVVDSIPTSLQKIVKQIPLDSEHRMSLHHDDPIREIVTVPWAPLIITRTRAGLFLWDGQTGKLETKILGARMKFHAFKNLKLIAYELPDGHLALYVPGEDHPLAVLPDFKQGQLSQIIDELEGGDAFLTDSKGRFYQIQNTPGEGIKIKKTSLVLDLVGPVRFRTVVRGAKANYVVVGQPQTVRPHQALQPADMNVILHIYSLDEERKWGQELVQLSGLKKQFALDPTGAYLLYTSSDTETSSFPLEAYLREHGY